MLLKVKNLNWFAGRPVVFLNEETAKEMNIFANDRVSLTNSKKIYSIVDIFSDVVRRGEIGLSKELSKILEKKDGSKIDVQSSEMSNATHLIQKKIDGKELSSEELDFLISEIVHNNLTEAEIAYFTAAQKVDGMSLKETIALTRAMIKTGATLKFKGKYIADKHCIGGISGNRTTPLVVAICASLGLTLPKTSSRAITSAAGTADVIETISNIDLSLQDLKRVVEKTGACLAWGGSIGLAPSDDKIIKVERILNLDIPGQMLASILSKKISAGSKYILIDIPYGFGSKIKNLDEAKRLGEKFIEISKAFKLKVKIVYTDGSQPIGDGLGPNLEMIDIINVLRRTPEAPKDLEEKAIYLSTELLKLCKIKNPRKKALDALNSGRAYRKFREIINAQNGKEDFEERVMSLRLGSYSKIIKSKKEGNIVEISNKGMNSLCRILGTPETKSAGVYLYRHKGPVKKGEPIMTIYSESESKIKDAKKFIKQFKPIKII